MANFRAPLPMVQVWTGFLWPIGPSIQSPYLKNNFQILTRSLKIRFLGVNKYIRKIREDCVACNGKME